MSQEKEIDRRGLRKIVAVSCVVAVMAIVITLTWGKKFRASSRGPSASTVTATEEYGYRLMAQTAELMGPDVSDPSMRFAGNRLSCDSCHLHAGAEPGSLSLSGAVRNYPKFSARTATIRTLEARINECMGRSMNGRPFPEGSPQLIAIATWIRSLAARDEAVGESNGKAAEQPKFQPPDRTAKVYAGKQIYERRCATCHGYNGSGLLASSNPIRGYVFPPLWGPDSFNTGAGMHRLLTAAPFTKARMPLGRPDLTDDEAYDVAAYINSQPRPEMPNLEADFPDKRTKQVDAAYPPFADPFPLEQHRLGPFQPIEAYYKNLKTESK